MEHIYVIHIVLAVYIRLDMLPGIGRDMCLGAFTKLRKETISFMSARLSVGMEQLGPHWADFHEI
jgi:hypothetical protein